MDWIQVLSAVVSVAAPLLILIVPKGVLCTRFEYELEGRVQGINYIFNYIPFVNSYKLVKDAKGPSKVLLIWGFIANLVMVGTIITRLTTEDILVNLVVTLVILVTLAINWLVECSVAFSIANLVDSKLGKILFIFPPLSYYFTWRATPKYFEKYKEEILGTFGDDYEDS